MTDVNPAQALMDMKPQKEFFVGIDSDGCAFDSMGIKQRECFCPWMIAYFGLQPVAEAARQCKEFADLFSKTRGANRHNTVHRILTELLPGHPMIKDRNFKVPNFRHYFAWIENGDSLLSTEGLELAIGQAESEEAKNELKHVLEWSNRVNDVIGDIVKDIPPFPYVRKSLEKVKTFADIVVVSATPCEALEREWSEHDIAQYVRIIAGQEMGKKAQHLDYATTDKYQRDHVLMIGDAPGDNKAAMANSVLFYPINPGDEIASWKRFHDEAFDKFINGTYAGDYEKQLIDEFNEYLPDDPPWLK